MTTNHRPGAQALAAALPPGRDGLQRAVEEAEATVSRLREEQRQLVVLARDAAGVAAPGPDSCSASNITT